VVVAVAGEMDLSNAAEFGGALAAVLDSRPARVIADLADLSFLDSSGIHCLFLAAERAATVGTDFGVRRPTRDVLRVLEITGTDSLLIDGAREGAAQDR
jgi:anti-sigma B factor antagonist